MRRRFLSISSQDRDPLYTKEFLSIVAGSGIKPIKLQPRPTLEVQAKIWNDLRYKDVAGTAYAWTHNFIVIDDPMSASIPYHLMNTSGLWTETPETFSKCYSGQKTPRSGYEWIEVWSLLHRVTQVRHDNNTYTITVEPIGKDSNFSSSAV
jgi:hypothetical protein